jgi:hypothetical protein
MSKEKTPKPKVKLSLEIYEETYKRTLVMQKGASLAELLGVIEIIKAEILTKIKSDKGGVKE